MPADMIGVWECCQEYKGIVNPGCHVLGPNACGLCISIRAVSTRVVENQCMCETKTKDNVFVDMTVAIQLEIMRDKAYEAIYRLDNPVQQIESLVEDVIRSAVPLMPIDEVYAAKDQIADAVKNRLEKCLSESGYQIHRVLIIELSPDMRVRNAMNEIDANRRLRVASLEKAEANKIILVKAAEADSDSMFLQGQGLARQRMAIADGLKHVVGGGEVLDPENVKELMLITQYFDMLNTLADGTNTTVFMPHTVSNLASISQEIRAGISGNPQGGDADGSQSQGALRQRKADDTTDESHI